jgi:hypothetical protein
MPPKSKANSVNTSLRKHGAETQMNKERCPTPDRRLDYSQPTTRSRVANSEPAPSRSDKTNCHPNILHSSSFP